jgi:hypothetical protein
MNPGMSRDDLMRRAVAFITRFMSQDSHLSYPDGMRALDIAEEVLEKTGTELLSAEEMTAYITARITDKTVA